MKGLCKRPNIVIRIRPFFTPTFNRKFHALEQIRLIAEVLLFVLINFFLILPQLRSHNIPD
jgi:hypothetical protein